MVANRRHQGGCTTEKALEVFSREDMHPTKFDILIFWFEGIGGCNRSIEEIREHISSSVCQSSSFLLQYEYKIEKEKQGSSTH